MIGSQHKPTQLAALGFGGLRMSSCAAGYRFLGCRAEPEYTTEDILEHAYADLRSPAGPPSYVTIWPHQYSAPTLHIVQSRPFSIFDDSGDERYAPS